MPGRKKAERHSPSEQSTNLSDPHSRPSKTWPQVITLLILFPINPHPLSFLLYILCPCAIHLNYLPNSSLAKLKKKNPNIFYRPVQDLTFTGSFFQSLHSCGPVNTHWAQWALRWQYYHTIPYMRTEPGLARMHDPEFQKNELTVSFSGSEKWRTQW